MEGVPSMSGAKVPVKKPKTLVHPVLPASATSIFFNDFWLKYMQKHPLHLEREVENPSDASLEEWEAMSDEERAPYVEIARKKREEYEVKMEEYRMKLPEYAKRRAEYREDYYRRYAAGEVEISYSDDYTDSEEDEGSESEEAAGEEDQPMYDVWATERLPAKM